MSASNCHWQLLVCCTISNTVARVAPAEASAQVRKLLPRRVPVEARESDDVVMEIDVRLTDA